MPRKSLDPRGSPSSRSWQRGCGCVWVDAIGLMPEPFRSDGFRSPSPENYALFRGRPVMQRSVCLFLDAAAGLMLEATRSDCVSRLSCGRGHRKARFPSRVPPGTGRRAPSGGCVPERATACEWCSGCALGPAQWLQSLPLDGSMTNFSIGVPCVHRTEGRLVPVPVTAIVERGVPLSSPSIDTPSKGQWVDNAVVPLVHALPRRPTGATRRWATGASSIPRMRNVPIGTWAGSLYVPDNVAPIE